MSSAEEQMDPHQIHQTATVDHDRVPSQKKSVPGTISDPEKRKGDSNKDLKLLYKDHLILNVIFGTLIGLIAVLQWYIGRAEFGRTAILCCLVVFNMLVKVCSRDCLEAYILTGAMVLDGYVALLMINREYTRIAMIPCMILFLIGTLGRKLRNISKKEGGGVNKVDQNNNEKIPSVKRTKSTDKLDLFGFVSYLLQLSLVTWTQYKGEEGCFPVLSDFLLFLCSALGALGGMLASPLAGLNYRAVSEEVLPVLHKTCTVVLFIAVHTMAAEWLGDDMIYVCLPELIVVLVWFTIRLGSSVKVQETISVSSVTSNKSKLITHVAMAVVAILVRPILLSLNANDSNMPVSWIEWAIWISAPSLASCHFHVWLLHSWPETSSESEELIRLLNVASIVGSSTATMLCLCMLVTYPRILYEDISSFEHKAIAAVVPAIFLLTSARWYQRHHRGHSETQIKGITVTAGWEQFCRGYLSYMLDTEKVATPSVSENKESVEIRKEEKPRVPYEGSDGPTAVKSVPEEQRPSMPEDLEFTSGLVKGDQSRFHKQFQTELMIGATEQELPVPRKGAVKVGYWGAPVGGPWDINDCSRPQRLASITIFSSEHQDGRIYGFSFVYVDQQGQSIQSSTWGSVNNIYPGSVNNIKIYPGEHLNHVSGTADDSGLTSLKLATNLCMYGPYGYPAGSNSFSVPLQQCKGGVVAFFGRSGDTLKALGVYVPGKKSSPVKVGPWGGYGGAPRDISNKPDQLQSVTISSTQAGGGRIHGFFFAYINQNGVPIGVGPWGNMNKGHTKTFSMSPGEYVNSISGTTDSHGVTSIKFSTNFNKEGYGPYGCSSGTAFSMLLPDNGTNDGQDNGAAVAFFGRSGDTLNAIGVYVGLAPKSDEESGEDD